MSEIRNRLTEAELKQFQQQGYVIVRGLLSQSEIEEIKTSFMELQRKGGMPGYFEPKAPEESGGDILRQYPRVMHPHRFMELAKHYMLHPAVMPILDQLFGEEALAAQSMFYYKPPGARGQALHQDNFYLKIEPGTCIAAWTAVDDADEENGGLFIVPGTQHERIQCPHQADPKKSFTMDEVDVPTGLQPVPAALKAGDVLFFNGSVIHGSYPNSSAERFRRAFICHYSGASTTKAGNFYKPMYRNDGTEVDIAVNEDSGPCGTEFATAAAGPH